MSAKKQEQDIMKQLGPATETNMKIKLPKAFVDYINENTVVMMIAHLDGSKFIVLKNYTIPRAIAFRF